MSRVVALVVIALAGCNASKVDVCNGVSGTCIDLTVTSSQSLSLETLRLTASGAFSGTHDTTTSHAVSLPVHVGVTVPAGISGAATLAVAGLDVSGNVLASGATDIVVVAGQKQTASVDIEPSGGGGDDLAGDDLAGVDGGGGDMLPVVPCDPKGVTGPQCVWRWQTPLPQGDDLLGVVAFSDSDTWAVNSEGLLLHRDATKWSYKTPVTAIPQPFFARGLAGGGAGGLGHLYVVGQGLVGTTATQFIYHTSDGTTFTSETINAPPAGTVLDTIASSASGLYAMAGGTDYPTGSAGLIYVRAAGGGSWSAATVPASNVEVTGIGMSDTQAVAVGHANGATAGFIWIAPNSGGNWGAFTAATFAPANPLNGACTGSGTFIVVGNAGTIAWSKNVGVAGGGFAAATTSGTSSALDGCAVVNANEAWAFGQNGALVHTTNGGANWSAVSSGVSTALNAGAQSPAAALTLVGATGTILRTTDSGTTIVPELSGPRLAAGDLWGIKPGVVYVVGAAGGILRTTNDGNTWAPVTSSGTTVNLSTVWGSSATDVYAGGAMGTIVHSTDGTNFTKIASVNLPTTASVTQISGAGADDVFATTLDGSVAKLLQSTDGGANWNQVTVTGMAATTSYMWLFAMPGHLWVQSQNQAVFHGVIAANKTITWNAQAVRFNGSAITDSLYSIGGNGTDFYAVTANDAFVHATSATSATAGTWDFENQSPMGIWGDPITWVRLTPSGSTLFMTGPSCGFLTSTNPGGSVMWSHLYTGLAAVSFGDVLPLADNDIFVLADNGIIHYGN